MFSGRPLRPRHRLDGLDVIHAAAWPRAIHQGGGTYARLEFAVP